MYVDDHEGRQIVMEKINFMTANKWQLYTISVWHWKFAQNVIFFCAEIVGGDAITLKANKGGGGEEGRIYRWMDVVGRTSSTCQYTSSPLCHTLAGQMQCNSSGSR